MELLVDGVEPDSIRQVMEDDVYSMDQRHRQGAQIFETLGSSAPALGLVGTLVGLVQMLQSMDDPSSIGPAMAVALLTTFYGAILSTAVFTPMAQKLKERNTEEILVKELTIKGVMGIALRGNPRLLAQMLEADLPPALRTP
jgi:chemotaxis protein MotA